MARQRDLRNIRERKIWRNGSWVTVYQVRLQVRDPITHKLRTFVQTFDDYKAAIQWRNVVKVRGQSGELGERDALSKEIQSVTLGKAIETYRRSKTFVDMVENRRRTKRGSDEDGMLVAFSKRECDRLCQKLVVDLTPNDWLDYIERRLAAGVKINTIKRELNPIRVMFTFATKRWQYPPKGYLFEGLFDQWKDDLQDGRDVTLNADIQFKVYRGIERLHTHKHRARWHALFTTAMATGLRRGELLQLEWPDIDLENGVITVRSAIAKNRKRRLVPITDHTAAMLENYFDLLPDDEKLSKPKIFGPAQPKVFNMTPGAHEQAWRRIARNGGFRHQEYHFHDTRHTAETYFTFVVRLDTPQLNWIMKGVFHGDKILNRYANPEIRDLVEEIRNKLSATEDKFRQANPNELPLHDVAEDRLIDWRNVEEEEQAKLINPQPWPDQYDYKGALGTNDIHAVVNHDGPKSRATLAAVAKRQREHARGLKSDKS